MQNSKVFDLRQRTIYFSLEVIRFLETVSKDYISKVIGTQLLRSATSIGANVVEAQSASSRKDFSNFYTIALKSANETRYWLTLLRDSKRGDLEVIGPLEKETNELACILAKSLPPHPESPVLQSGDECGDKVSSREKAPFFRTGCGGLLTIKNR